MQRHKIHQMYEGKGQIELEDGEFLCPTCRKLSNCLLPLIEQDNLVQKSQKTFEGEQFSAWLNRQENLTRTSTRLQTPLVDALDTIARRTSFVKLLKLPFWNSKGFRMSALPPLYAFAESIGNTIQNLELAGRREKSISFSSFSSVANKGKKDLYYLINAGFRYEQPQDVLKVRLIDLWANFLPAVRKEQEMYNSPTIKTFLIIIQDSKGRKKQRRVYFRACPITKFIFDLDGNGLYLAKAEYRNSRYAVCCTPHISLCDYSSIGHILQIEGGHLDWRKYSG